MTCDPLSEFIEEQVVVIPSIGRRAHTPKVRRTSSVRGIHCRVRARTLETGPSKVANEGAAIAHENVLEVEIVVIEFGILGANFEKGPEHGPYDASHCNVVQIGLLREPTL